jgi:hypothetical protein
MVSRSLASLIVVIVLILSASFSYVYVNIYGKTATSPQFVPPSTTTIITTMNQTVSTTEYSSTLTTALTTTTTITSVETVTESTSSTECVPHLAAPNQTTIGFWGTLSLSNGNSLGTTILITWQGNNSMMNASYSSDYSGSGYFPYYPIYNFNSGFVRLSPQLEYFRGNYWLINTPTAFVPETYQLGLDWFGPDDSSTYGSLRFTVIC